MSAETQPVRIFIAYSSKDLEFQKELKNHLEPLVRNKRIVIMDNYAINPGENWNEKIGQMLEQSDIVLLLLSADALASPHFFREAGIAIKQHRQGRTDIIPVKLRPCDLEDEPLLQELNLLEVLPEKDVPVVKWPLRDDAYLSIVKGLKRVLQIREEAFIAFEQRAQRQKEYADLIAQANALMKKKKWAEAKDLLDKALTSREEGFEPGQELLERQLDKCKEEIKAAERKKQQAAVEAADNAEWQTAEEADTEAAYKKYLLQYPQGLHANFAQAGLEFLTKKRAEALLAEKEDERKSKEEAEKKKKEEAAYKRRKAEAAERKKLEQTQHNAYIYLQDDKNDPFANAMLHITGGTFNMGETFSDFIGAHPLYNAPPVHYVSVKDFYISKGAVTQGQWKQIMGDYPSSFKGDALPVENVSWDEVQTFIKKLNEKTGKQYRLPTEAELEYLTSFSLKLKTNLKGLFSFEKSRWEWCQDVWHDKSHDLKDAPTDGSAWDGNDSKRVLHLYSGGDPGYAIKGRRQGRNRDLSDVFFLGSIVFRIAR